MFQFILRQIVSFRFKSLSIIGIIALFSFLLAVFLFLSNNIIGALDYYSPHTVDPNRVTFSTQTSIFDMLSRNGGGISPEIVQEIQKDTLFARTRIFTFIDTNIVGGFDIFTFHLDTDIPVFGIQDSLGDMKGFGISPSMIHYYNLELAGSHPMFPVLDEKFLKGKTVSLLFGASKIFQTSGKVSSPLKGSITSVDSDYPGFGVVAPLSKIDEKLQEIGDVARQPYKVVAYMKNPLSRKNIEEKYGNLHPIFDRDLMDIRESQFRAIRLSVFGVGLFFSVIVIILLFLLFLGFFREKDSIFRLLRVYGVGFPYRQIILYGEAFVFIAAGSIVAFIGITLSQKFLIARFGTFLYSHGILFPLVPISGSDIALLFSASISFILLLIFFSSRRT